MHQPTPSADLRHRVIAAPAGRLHVVEQGTGPLVLLVHGFPETSAQWHRIAPKLAERFTVVVPDLRGYGWSSAPASRDGDGYTKRAMGADLVALMDDLGFARFRFVGNHALFRLGAQIPPGQPDQQCGGDPRHAAALRRTVVRSVMQRHPTRGRATTARRRAARFR